MTQPDSTLDNTKSNQPDALDAKLLEQIKAILRRDLKLGADEPIDNDMPLIGGDTHLDSVDILLLLSSFEQELAVRIPDSDVGEKVFGSVASLADYITKHRSDSSLAEPKLKTNDIESWRQMLPHGDEFIFISQVDKLESGSECQAKWLLSGEEWFFTSHFPNKPLVPAVYITEALAQTAGLAALSQTDENSNKQAVIARTDIQFQAPVVPPASINLKAKVTRTALPLCVCEVLATVDNKPVANGMITLHKS